MATAGLTGEGLKRYQRWLAVQRAKGTEPSAAMIQSYLQGEIQAGIASDTQREALSLNREALGLKREALASDIETRNRRLDLIEDEQDRQKRADTFRGISEIAKTVGALNQITDGGIAEGLKAGWGFVSDAFTGGDAVAEVLPSATDVDMFSGVEDFATEILDDVMDWSGLF